ncbi:MAG: hypothetical protein EOO48_01500 [Flavobacterium sp.]|nr:MAG: hypothetical protein EOO48_01500 [Flavobacterium sp.]
MKTAYILIALFFLKAAHSQNEVCTIKQMQLETYAFVTANLEAVRKNIPDHDALIEVSIFMKSQKIAYNLVSPENSYSGKNKTQIDVWSELDKFLKHKIKACKDEKYLMYDELTFRIPLSDENIQKAIKQVNGL